MAHHLQLHKAADFLEMNIEKTATMQSLRNKIPCLDKAIQHFLSLAGFEMQDNTVCYPTTTTEMFESCELLTYLLSELDDEQLIALSLCMEDAALSYAIIETLRPVWENSEMEFTVAAEQEWLSTAMGKQLFAGFSISLDGGLVQIPKDSLLDVQALYLILAALYVE